MAIVTIRPQLWNSLPVNTPDNATSTMDAAGESLAVIGRAFLAAGSGSKTISTGGGGGIWIRVAVVTAFANAGTTIRVGVQDVSLTTGLEDGTFDVNGDLVGGTDTLTAATYNLVAMDAGTKTIAHGDLIAIVSEMVSRGGADSVGFDRWAGMAYNSSTPSSVSLGFPYGTVDTGTLAKGSLPMFGVLKFDDGTIGWIEGMELPMSAAPTANSFNSGSVTFDEMAATFIPQVPMQVSAIGLTVGNIAAADPFEIILYSDPFGTPTIIETVVPDADVLGSTGFPISVLVPVTPVTLAAGSTYAVSLRPTSANNVSFGYYDLGAGFDALKGVNPFGTNLITAHRLNQTGAFSTASANAEWMPSLLLLVTGLDNGSSAALKVHPGMAGGARG